MPHKVNYIDSLRGIAILMVIFVHTAETIVNKSVFLTNFAQYGQLGVQLFFIASAYTLCLSWSRRTDEPYKIRNFAIRRLFRIAPLYYVGVILYFIVSVVINYERYGTIEPAAQYSSFNILVNLLFLNGFYPPANNNIVPGGWSIGTEMCFYALFPLIMCVLSNKARHQGYASTKYLALSLFASQLLLMLTWMITGSTIENNNFIYFNIITQLPVFLTGITFYFINSQGMWPVRSVLGNVLFFIAFTCLTLCLWLAESDYLFSFIPFLSGISFVFLFKTFELTPAVNIAVLGEIGKVSYSMYIFHFLFAHKTASYMNRTFHFEELLGENITLAIFYAISVSLTFLLAKISEKTIEQRFIQIGRNIIKNRAIKNATALAQARR